MNRRLWALVVTLGAVYAVTVEISPWLFLAAVLAGSAAGVFGLYRRLLGPRPEADAVVPQPRGMPLLDPMEVCPGCDSGGTPRAWLSPDEQLWIKECWDCGYRWPQGDTHQAWLAARRCLPGLDHPGDDGDHHES